MQNFEIQKLHKQAELSMQRKNFTVANKIYNNILIKDKNDIVALYKLALNFFSVAQYMQAKKYIEKFFELDGFRQPAALNLYGQILIRSEKYDRAIEILELCNSINPKNDVTYTNLASAYNFKKDYNNVIKYCFESIKLNLNNKHAFNNLGGAFFSTANYDDARIALSTAIDLDNNFFEAILNLATLEQRLGNHGVAIQNFHNALSKIEPSQDWHEAKVRFFLSFSQLSTGNLEEGWKNYEYGFHPAVKQYNGRTPIRKFDVPLWNGHKLEHEKILIWREQGLGDEILYMSCLKDLGIDLKNIIIECDPRLVPLYSRSFPECRVRSQSMNTDLSSPYSDFSYHLPMGSMMKFTRNKIEDFNTKTDYIVANSEYREEFKNRLKKYGENRKKIGICWRSGNIDHLRNEHYLQLKDFEMLFNRSDLVFVNLQYGNCESEIQEVEELFGVEIVRWQDVDLKNDLEKVYSLIDSLDCVITAGTAVHAFSGSVGKETIWFGKGDAWTKLGQDELPWYRTSKFVEINKSNPQITIEKIATEFNRLIR